MVNPKTNRDLSVSLSSVEAGHWYSRQIRLTGGAPDTPNVVTAGHLLKWSSLKEATLHNAVAQFAAQHKLDPNALRQFVQTQAPLNTRGQVLVDRARTARTAVTFQHLEDWRNLSQQHRNTLTLEGYAADHNLNPLRLMEHIRMDGSLRDAGKVLEKFTRNERFTSITEEHLLGWSRIYRTPGPGLAMAAFFPVVLNTFEGLRSVPREYLEVARVYEFSVAQTLARVVAPAAAPSLFTGIQLSLIYAWLATLGAEYLLASGKGLGNTLIDGREHFWMDLVLFGVVVIGLVGFALNWVLAAAERRLLAWRDRTVAKY